MDGVDGPRVRVAAMPARRTPGDSHLSEEPGRRGPRSDAGAARSAILTSARRLFLDADFQSVSLRAVARDAGVDTSLVSYYFGSKQHLYLEAMSLPNGPHRIIAAVCEHATPLDLGESLVRAFVEAWDGHVTASDESGSPSMQGVVQAILEQPGAFESLRGFYEDMLIAPVARVLETVHDPAEAHIRASLGLARLLGIFTTRYIVGLDGLRDLSGEELVAREAPGLQLTLTGPRPGLPTSVAGSR